MVPLVRVLVLVLFVCSACRRTAEPAEPAPGPARVRCVVATTEKLARTVTLRGLVEVAPAHHALVAAQVAGRLNTLLVHEGERVKAGDVLAEVDGRQARDAALQAKAAMTGADAALVNATVTAERMTRLLEHGIAARQEVDDAQSRLAAARAMAATAKSAFDAADRTAAFATVRAPLSGVVLRTLRAPGDLLDGTPATPILELGDPAFLTLLSSAIPRDLIALAIGQKGEARFEALPDKAWKVAVSTIAPMIDPTTGVGSVRLAFEGAAPPIGLSGEASLVVGEVEALSVPTTALRGAANGGSEVLVCGEGTLRASSVELGVRANGKVEVRSGLAAGERFVATGVLGLEDGVAWEAAP